MSERTQNLVGEADTLEFCSALDNLDLLVPELTQLVGRLIEGVQTRIREVLRGLMNEGEHEDPEYKEKYYFNNVEFLDHGVRVNIRFSNDDLERIYGGETTIERHGEITRTIDEAFPDSNHTRFPNLPDLAWRRDNQLHGFNLTVPYDQILDNSRYDLDNTRRVEDILRDNARALNIVNILAEN